MSQKRITHDEPLLLGSASPRRREILAELGIPFVVHAAAADERMEAGEAGGAYLERIVRAKLDAVRASLGASRLDQVVLVADTIVVVDGAVLGKPEDAADARRMIDLLAGRTHEVSTRFAIASSTIGEPPQHAQTVTTRVTFRALTEGEVLLYAASGEGMDKAGGYAVQGKAMAFASRIEGSYSNVVGLPASDVVVALRRLGLW